MICLRCCMILISRSHSSSSLFSCRDAFTWTDNRQSVMYVGFFFFFLSSAWLHNWTHSNATGNIRGHNLQILSSDPKHMHDRSSCDAHVAPSDNSFIHYLSMLILCRFTGGCWSRSQLPICDTSYVYSSSPAYSTCSQRLLCRWWISSKLYIHMRIIRNDWSIDWCKHFLMHALISTENSDESANCMKLYEKCAEIFHLDSSSFPAS